MHAMGVVMIQENKDILERLESYLSNPLQPFDYPLMQEAYNHIIALKASNNNLHATINLLGKLNIDLELDRNSIYKIADKMYLCVDGADKEFENYQKYHSLCEDKSENT